MVNGTDSEVRRFSDHSPNSPQDSYPASNNHLQNTGNTYTIIPNHTTFLVFLCKRNVRIKNTCYWYNSKNWAGNIHRHIALCLQPLSKLVTKFITFFASSNQLFHVFLFNLSGFVWMSCTLALIHTTHTIFALILCIGVRKKLKFHVEQTQLLLKVEISMEFHEPWK